MIRRTSRQIDIITDPPSRWKYDPVAKQWVTYFAWACGVSGTASTTLDPDTDRKTGADMARYIVEAEARDCPECISTELSWRPPPAGHTPQHTHRRRLRGRRVTGEDPMLSILGFYESAISPNELLLDEAIETTEELIGMLKERLQLLYADRRRENRRVNRIARENE